MRAALWPREITPARTIASTVYIYTSYFTVTSTLDCIYLTSEESYLYMEFSCLNKLIGGRARTSTEGICRKKERHISIGIRVTSVIYSVLCLFLRRVSAKSSKWIYFYVFVYSKSCLHLAINASINLYTVVICVTGITIHRFIALTHRIVWLMDTLLLIPTYLYRPATGYCVWLLNGRHTRWVKSLSLINRIISRSMCYSMRFRLVYNFYSILLSALRLIG
jgi:hypothetical protein